MGVCDFSLPISDNRDDMYTVSLYLIMIIESEICIISYY